MLAAHLAAIGSPHTHETAVVYTDFCGAAAEPQTYSQELQAVTCCVASERCVLLYQRGERRSPCQVCGVLPRRLLMLHGADLLPRGASSANLRLEVPSSELFRVVVELCQLARHWSRPSYGSNCTASEVYPSAVVWHNQRRGCRRRGVWATQGAHCANKKLTCHCTQSFLRSDKP